MARKLKSDKLLFTATLVLVCTGVVMVYSASAVWAMDRADDQYLFLFKQLTWAVIGLSLVPVIMRIDYRTYREPIVIWTALAIVGVLLVAVLFGRPVKGATRWLNLGGLGIQPSELAKIAVIIFVAALLERRMDRVNEPSHALLPIGLVVGGLVGLILLQPDLGTAVAILTIAGAMIFAAGISYQYLLGLSLAAMPALYFLIMRSEYRRRRIFSFIDPWADPLNDGFQIIQSFIAVGTGGIFGRGLMDGVQKLFYLPEPHNDFIYSVIGEELGLVGTTLILLCFCIITWRGLRASFRAPDRFGAFLALGLTMMVSFQAFFNMSVVLGLLPTKGIPLPFVSYGGSSLLVNMIAVAVLLNISQHASSSARVVTTEMPLAVADA
jgi:cell division protein FtsW